MVLVKTAVLGNTALPTLEVTYQNLGGRFCPNLQGITADHEWKKICEYRGRRGLKVQTRVHQYTDLKH
jgi:hypothetical protein